mgnify:CR=1 FL=1
MAHFCFQNGNFLPQSEAKLEITNLAFTRGYGAFELFRTYEFTPFFLKEHLARFQNSANVLGLHYPKSVELVIERLLKKNNTPNLVFRLYLSEDESGESQFIVLCDPITLPPESQYERGIPIITTNLTRHFHEIKSTCYLAALVSLKEAAKKGAEDALFKNSKGELLELTKSNFFAVIDGILRTPKEGILFGITRSIVLELANKLDLEILEGPIEEREIPRIEEAFCTSTIREILPLSKIDTHTIPLGPITRKLQAAFRAELAIKFNCVLMKS